MNNSSYQSGVFKTESPFLWIVPIVFDGGRFMGVKLDNYKNNILTVSHYAEWVEKNKKKVIK